MQYVWVILGTTGKEADRQKWIVAVATTEAAAQRRIGKLTELLGEMAGEEGRWPWDVRRQREELIRHDRDGDERCAIDTGTVYSLEKRPLIGPPALLLDSRLAVFLFSLLLNVAVLLFVALVQPGRWLVERLLK